MSEQLRIGTWIGPLDPYWVQVMEAVYQRSLQLPVRLIQLDNLMYYPDSNDERRADTILARDLDALITIYLNNRSAEILLNAGLPVVHITETELEHPLLVSPEGHYASAFLAGKFIAKHLNGKGKIVVAGGLSAGFGEDGKSRLAGIHDAFKPYSEMICHQVSASWYYAEAYPVLLTAMQKIEQPVDGIFGLSDPLALAARDAGIAMGKVHEKTVVVGVNGDPLALAAIAEGRMTATVSTDIGEYGRIVMDTAYALAQGNKPAQKFHLEFSLVNAENVADLALKKLIAIADIPSRLVGVNRQAEENRMAQLEISAAINQKIGAILNETQLLHEVVDLIRNHYQYDLVHVYFWLPNERVLKREYPVAKLGEKSEIPLEKAGLIGKVIENGAPIIIPDIRRSTRFSPDPLWPTTHSRTVVPIRFSGEIIGLIDLHNRQQTNHLPQELLGLQLLADQIGIARQNARLYADAIAARAAAEKADQLKTRLLANVSHELRAPLNVILGYSQVLVSNLDTKKKIDITNLKRDIVHIFRSGEHLIRLINDLLDMSRLEIDALELFTETIETHSFLEDVFTTMVGSLEQKNVLWKMDLPPRLPIIQADPVRLRQILLNLLSNAHKFTPKGQIILGAEVEPPHLHIWVADSGVGISHDFQEKIFEPFVTVQFAGNARAGVGLGLSITRRLVALHGGSMSLESQAGKGTTFHVYMPLPGLSGQPVLPVNRKAEPILLLISRNSDPGPTLRQFCLRRGLAWQPITSAEQAAAFLHDHQPAALAWDMSNAHQSDWSLIQQLRRYTQVCRLPFLFYGQQEHSTDLTNVLLKPISGETLLEQIVALCPENAQGSVLVVDDDAQAREMVAVLIEKALPGLTVQFAKDGQEALDILAEAAPALVVLDLMMPKVDGFEVLERIRKNERTQSVPVIVMSGKLLTEEDARRISYARVVFHAKELLSDEEIIRVLKRAFETDDYLSPPTSALVKKSLTYMHKNYARPLTRPEIAAAIGVSESYLSEIFKQEVGISFWDCLNRFRVRLAKELLLETNKNVTTIAFDVGFEDISYFNRVFNRYVGISPARYRRSKKGR